MWKACLENVAVRKRVCAGPDAVQHVGHILVVLLEDEVEDVVPVGDELH